MAALVKPDEIRYGVLQAVKVAVGDELVIGFRMSGM
jgi:2,4-dienoyl-CoA reductase-like NADH-dependent reductase (Old Yellow Enzyme family)